MSPAGHGPGTPPAPAASPFAGPLRSCLGVEGVEAVALVASDGMLVHQERTPQAGDLATIAAYIADLFRRADAAAFECGLGRARESVIKMTDHTLVVYGVTAGYHLLLLLGPRGITGRGRWELRRVAGLLKSEIE